MITYLTGDLLASDEEHIAHGCNTAGLMGAGIAGLIANCYPVVYGQYVRRCSDFTFPLGTAMPVRINSERTVWNLATQVQPGPNASQWGIMLSFGNMMEQMAVWGQSRVAIPRIGAGIGGLKWSQVEATIIKVQKFVDSAPEVVVYTLPSEADKDWG